MASRYELSIDQGSKAVRTLYVVSKVTRLPIDLTGCTARMHVRRWYDSSVPFLTLTTENSGLVVLPGTAGKLQIVLPASLTSNLTEYAGVYDVEVVFSDGEPRRVVEGEFKMKPEATR